MSLTHPFARAPFGTHRSGRFDFDPPEHVRYWEPWPRRMRAVLAGQTVLDSSRGILLWETGVRVGQRLAENCLTASPRGPDGEELLRGYVTFHQSHGPQGQADPRAMDEWFEEDDPIHGHPRDPYHRVDVRSSARHVIVRHNGEVVAESRRPKLVFETGNPIRYYLPLADVRIELLTKSEFVSACPYKGDGQHWHLSVHGDTVENAAWSLPHPLPEGLAAAEHVCFYPEKADVEVDGTRVPE